MPGTRTRFPDLVVMLEESCRRFPGCPLFGTRSNGRWRWTTFREFEDLVKKCRAGLLALGVRAGDRVAVISNNRLEWAVSAHATYGLGAVYVPMFETQLDDEWAYILQDSGATVCFVASQQILLRIKERASEYPDLGHVITFDGSVDVGHSFAALLHRSPGCLAAHVTADTLACMIYTSGTTGKPKGVELTHGNLASNVSAILDMTPIAPGERSVGFLPWAHVYGGCVELHTAIVTGGAIAICEDPSQLNDYLAEVRPSMLFAVPRIWDRIYDGVKKQIAERPPFVQAVFDAGMRARSRQKLGQDLTLTEQVYLELARRFVFSKILERLGGRLRFAFSGAAALSREVAEFIDNLGIDVYEGYGMTEYGGVITSNRPEERRIGSVGKPAPEVRLELDPAVPGAMAGEGEIVVYGPGVMQGYRGLGTVTRETLTPDGGLRTGDLGRFDMDGYLYITGRVKDLFKLSNGRYVAPAAIEEKLQQSPLVSQCVLYGDDRPYVVALIVVDAEGLAAWASAHDIVADPGEMLSDPRVRQRYSEELEKYGSSSKGFERIGGFLLESEPLTTANHMLTPTLKVKRRNVVRKYKDRFRALYAEGRPERTERAPEVARARA